VSRGPTALVVAAALSALAPARAGEAEAGAPREFQRRGVYFLEGHVRSPLAGLGPRGEFAANRLALDDDRTRARWDPRGRKLVLTNTTRYEEETQVACVLVLGTGTSESGEQVPIGVHLSVYKQDDEFVTTMHGHVTVREGIEHADFLPLQVVLDDGQRRTVALTKTIGLRAVRNPFEDSTLATVIGLKGVDNLEGAEVDITQPGAHLADGSVGMGRGFLSKLVLRAELISLDGSRPLAPGQPWAEIFGQGAYELRLTALSSLLPKEPWDRNVFLLGLDDVAMLRPLRADGLADGQTLSFVFRGGEGTIRFAGQTHVVKDAAEVVRRYLEFDFVGGIIRHQLERRLRPR